MRKLKLEDFDHPVVFLFFNTMAIIAIIALLGIAFTRFGLPGPAALVGAGPQQ
jgi:hypothetical protein